MTDRSASPSSSLRRTWMAVLARTPRAELETALNTALADIAAPRFDWLRQPETGLAMVRGRIGGTGDAFNLGEATVTRATLRLCDTHPAAADCSGHANSNGDSGKAIVGVACHLGRDKRRAGLAALADALLQMPEHHDRLRTQLVEPLAARIAVARAARREDAASTRVEFFTMVRGD